MTASEPAHLRGRFLEGMSYAAATVNIVTTDGPAGRHGVTVSAMTAVSADSTAPSLLVCVHHLSPAATAIQRNGVFCVNVLRDDQSSISDVFAGRLKTETGDKFSATAWTTQKTGAPRILDALVAFDCEVKGNLRYGTHHIFIGEVADIFVDKGGNPLIYANRAYGRPASIAPAGRAPAPSSEELRLGSLVTLSPYVVPELVAELLARRPQARVGLVEASHNQLLASLRSCECDLALTYGIDLGADIAAEPLIELPAYVLLPAGHPLAEQPKVSLADLAHEPMILLDLPMSRDYFLGLFKAHGLEPQIRLRSSSFETVRGLVGIGLGFALLGTKPANSMTYDGRALITRPITEGSPDSTVVLASLKGRADPPLVAEVRSLAEGLFGRRAGGLRSP